MKKKAFAKEANSGKDNRALEIKVAHSAHDWRRAKEALGREHGLGAGREAGDRLCHLIFEEGRLARGVGVMGHWCRAEGPAARSKTRNSGACAVRFWECPTLAIPKVDATRSR